MAQLHRATRAPSKTENHPEKDATGTSMGRCRSCEVAPDRRHTPGMVETSFLLQGLIREPASSEAAARWAARKDRVPGAPGRSLGLLKLDPPPAARARGIRSLRNSPRLRASARNPPIYRPNARPTRSRNGRSSGSLAASRQPRSLACSKARRASAILPSA